MPRAVEVVIQMLGDGVMMLYASVAVLRRRGDVGSGGDSEGEVIELRTLWAALD
jgi:hypothetical protein